MLDDRWVYRKAVNAAITGTYKLIIQNEAGQPIDYDLLDEIDQLFCQLKDVRGCAGIKGVKGKILIKEGNGGEDNLRFSIENKRNMRDCSKEYQLWLQKIKNLTSDDNLLILIEQEQ